MSYTPRFGEYIYAKDTFENTDTRWIIAEFTDISNHGGTYYIDNYGNILICKSNPDPIKSLNMLKYYEPVTEQYVIPLSDDLITTLKFNTLINIPFTLRTSQNSNIPATISFLNMIKSLAQSHYKNYQELQALKQRMQTLEEKLSRSLTPFDVESHVFSTTPFDDFRPVRITTTHCSKSGLF